MAEMQYQALVEPLEPTLFTEPPSGGWNRPIDQPLFPKKRYRENLSFLTDNPLEPSLFTEPPSAGWNRETNQPLFAKKRHPDNLGWYDKPLNPADFVVISVPDLVVTLVGQIKKRRRQHTIEDLTCFAYGPNPRLFGTSIADYLTGTVRISGSNYSYNVALSNLQASTAPGVNDDGIAGYAPGSLWIDKTNENAYICIRSTPGAAVWKLMN